MCGRIVVMDAFALHPQGQTGVQLESVLNESGDTRPRRRAASVLPRNLWRDEHNVTLDVTTARAIGNVQYLTAGGAMEGNSRSPAFGGHQQVAVLDRGLYERLRG